MGTFETSIAGAGGGNSSCACLCEANIKRKGVLGSPGVGWGPGALAGGSGDLMGGGKTCVLHAFA